MSVENHRIKVNNFILSVEEYDVPEMVVGRPESGKAYRIKAEPINPLGYYHCGYISLQDALTVLERLTDRFDYQVFNVNFSKDFNPIRIHNKLDR